MRRAWWMLLFGVLPAGATAFAHPGHGVIDDQSPAHYVLEPVHALPLLLLAGACAGAWYAVRALRQRRCRR